MPGYNTKSKRNKQRNQRKKNNMNSNQNVVGEKVQEELDLEKKGGEKVKASESDSGKPSVFDRKTTQLYKMVEISGKGLGMVATQNIPRGTLLLEEEPVMVFSRNMMISDIPSIVPHIEDCMLSEEEFERLVDAVCECNMAVKLGGVSLSVGNSPLKQKQRAGARRYILGLEAIFKKLPENKRREVMALHDRHEPVLGKKTPFGIYATNSVVRGVGSDSGVLCLIVSRFNHACSPNVSHAWVEPHERIYASRDIKKGEELNTLYCEPMEDYKSRQQHLKQVYGFDCQCETCLLPADARAKSDCQRRALANLDRSIGVAFTNPHRGLSLVEEIFEKLKQENLFAPALEGRWAYDAFQLASALGDLPQARKWINKAVENYIITDGEKSPHTIKMMGYKENPKSHLSWKMAMGGMGGMKT